MFRRLLIYFREMFPFQVYLPYSLLSYFCLYFITEDILTEGELRINSEGIIGWITVLCVLIILRILDEFKDIETDKRLFPDRPLPRGGVSYRDIKILGIALFIIMVMINIYLSWVLLPFAAMMIYIWASYKWFFLKKIISENLFLTLITHQPITLMVNLYIVSISFKSMGFIQLNGLVIVSILAFSFPVTAWETSRKIRSNGNETDYVTYSKLIGPVKATLLPLFSLIVAIGLFICLGIVLNFPLIVFICLFLILVSILFFYIRFQIKPNDRNLCLKPVAEISTILITLIFLIQLILKSGICWC